MRFPAAVLAVILTASALAQETMPKPRPVSDAESAAVAAMARYLAGGPQGMWNELSLVSPLRKLGNAAALQEIEARLGPHHDLDVSLQTVVPSLRDRAAAFTLLFPSGVDDTVVLEMKRVGTRWAVHSIRTSGEPAIPAAVLTPRKKITRHPLYDVLQLHAGLAAALPALLLGLVAMALLRSRRRLAIALALTAAIGVTASAAVAVVLSLPTWFPPTETIESRQVPELVPLAPLLPLRRAVATGDEAAVKAALAKVGAGDTRDVGLLWKVQLDMLAGRYDVVDRQIAPLRWRMQTPLANILRARAAFFSKRVTDAVIAYEAASGAGAGRDALWLEMAGTLGVLGFEDRANGFIRRAARAGSREPELYYMNASRAALDDKPDQAEAYFLAAWKMQPIPRSDALSMGILWQVFRRPTMTNVLRLNAAEEAQFASPVRSPIALAEGATAEVVGDCMLIRAGKSQLRVPGGAAIAPLATPIVDAAAWQRREEEELLAELDETRVRASTPAAVADPQLRDRITVTAGALAEKNRWNDVLSLTETLQARDERVPIELILMRGHALSRAGRNADLRRLIVDLLNNPAVKRRREPFALVAVADLLSAIDYWDAAVALLTRARAETELPGLDHRIAQIKIEKKLAQSFAVVSTTHFEVRYPTDLVSRPVAERTAAILESELARLRREWLPGPKFRRTKVNVLWWGDFRDYSGSDYVVGLYTDEIFLPTAGVEVFPPPVVAIMTHELMHAILANDTNDLAPRWFHEALASRVEMADVKRNAFQAFRDEQLLSVGLLDAVTNNSPDPELIGSAYEIGESTLRFVEARWGRGGVQKLVRDFAAGQTTDAAVLNSLGIPVAELDRQARFWGTGQSVLWEGPVLRYDKPEDYRRTRKGTVTEMGRRR